MKIKTSELEGAALDWAVAKAEALPIRHDPMGFISGANAGYWVWGTTESPKLKIGVGGRLGYSPSTDWRQGGPLIDRLISNLVDLFGDWYAEASEGMYGKPLEEFDGKGPTALIAAMRAIVAAELGDDVGVPDELLEAA